jgi:hypothetical protein
VSFSLKSLFAPSRRDQFLSRYVVREIHRGRPLAEVLEDPYVVNRSSEDERARLLDRPEIVEAVGERTIEELRAGLLATR